MVSLTPGAARQVILQAGEPDGPVHLRVAAKDGPDGEPEFALGFDEPRKGDREIECEGVTLLVAAASGDRLDGVVIDWIEVAPGEHRFAFARPAGA